MTYIISQVGDGTTSVVIIAAELLKNADELILIKGTKVRTAASIILRGPSDMYCDEMERSIHDALCVIKVGKPLDSQIRLAHLANTICTSRKYDFLTFLVAARPGVQVCVKVEKVERGLLRQGHLLLPNRPRLICTRN